MTTRWALPVTIATAVMLAMFATVPPAQRGSDAPAAAFSAARAMADVVDLARAPHPTGSAEEVRVRERSAARLAGLGAEVRIAPEPLSREGAERIAKWSGRPAPAQVFNVVGVVPGRDRAAPAVLLMAHHDTVWDSPGAADDTAGVAASLEIVRALKAGPPPARDLVVLFTDGEELGLEGAWGFFRDDPLRSRIGAVVNLEARGGGGRAAMFETGRGDGEMMRLFARSVRRPSATSLSSFIYSLLPNNTDFTPAKRAGLPGVNFAFIGRPELYHSPAATPERLDRGALQDMGAQGLDIVRALVSSPRLPRPSPNLVFFDVFGLGLIHYAPVWGWAVAAAAAALLGAAVARSNEPIRKVAEGAAASVGLMLAAGVLLFGANLVSGAGKGANYYDRLASIPLLMGVGALLTTAVLAPAIAWLRRTGGDGARGAAGLALPPLILAVAAQVAAPLIAFQIVWPLLLAGGVAAVTSGGGALWRWATAAALAAIGLGWLLAQSFFLYQGVGPDLPWVMAAPLGLAAPLLAPLAPPASLKRISLAAAALACAGVAVAVYVRLDPLAPTVPPYSFNQPGH